MYNLPLKILIISISIITFSCSGDRTDVIENGSSNSIENINLSEKLNLDSGEVKMFTMPTPLQIATALSLMGVNYSEEFLLTHKERAIDSDIRLSLNLGMYLTDLGYTTVYNNPQKSINYAKNIQVIMDELPISLYVNDVFKKRFENNLEHKDSLCKIILEGYNDANKSITDSHNEGLGLLILTGAYIEGLYLASSSTISEHWINEYDNLFIQQKLFLDNFLVLLINFNSNDEIAGVLEKLSALKVAFDPLEISYDKKDDKHLLVHPITKETKQRIKKIVSDLRQGIIN